MSTAANPPRPAPASVSPASSIQPMRMLRMYWPWVAGAAAFGLVVGLVSFFVARTYAPRYASTTIFEVLPAGGAVGVVVGIGGDEEIERYMATQVQVLTSDRILQRAVEQPQIELQTEWAEAFKVSGTFSPIEAAEELAEIVRARTIPQTNLVSLRVATSERMDAKTIADVIQDVYIRDNVSVTTRDAQARIEDMQREVRRLTDDIQALDIRMQNLIDEQNLTAFDERNTQEFAEMQNTQRNLVLIREQLASIRETYQNYLEMYNNPEGRVYPEAIREGAERSPIAADLERRIELAEADLRSDREIYGDGHRSVRNRRIEIRTLEEKRREIIEEEMEVQFTTTIESFERSVASLEAQEQELQTDVEGAERRLSELQQQLKRYENFSATKREKRGLAETLTNRIAELNLVMDRGGRVRVIDPAAIPTSRAFPKLVPFAGGGIFLFAGLASGLVVLKELREQRIRMPADVHLIPRTRVLGVVPEIGLDPSSPERFETACLDRPEGAIAESVRQIRTTVLKVARAREHKSVLFVSGLPNSGTSSFVANLAVNCASIDLRVLLVDANLRRPAQRRIFGLGPGPGLAEILKRGASLDEAVQTAPSVALDVLPAGEDREHAYERFNTPAMTRLMEEAGERYDLILIDAPPAVVAGDATSLAAVADASALIIRAYSEKRGLVARVRNQLAEAHAEFLGVIVNAVRPSAGGYFKRNFQTTHAYRDDEPGEGDAGDAGAAPEAEREREPAAT